MYVFLHAFFFKMFTKSLFTNRFNSNNVTFQRFVIKLCYGKQNAIILIWKRKMVLQRFASGSHFESFPWKQIFSSIQVPCLTLIEYQLNGYLLFDFLILCIFFTVQRSKQSLLIACIVEKGNDDKAVCNAPVPSISAHGTF